MYERTGLVHYRSRWRLNDIQRLVAVAALVSAAFFTFMAIGSGRLWPFVVAVVIMAVVGTGVVLLGFRHGDASVRRGYVRVLTASDPPSGAIVADCDMQVLLDIAGIDAVQTKLRAPAAPVIKWPRPGMVLPVDVSAIRSRHPRGRHPGVRHPRIRWDEVPERRVRPGHGPLTRSYGGPLYTEDTIEGSLVVHADADGPAPHPAGSIPRQRDQGPSAAQALQSPTGSSAASGSATAADRPPELGIMLIVSDLARSRRFYRDIIGCAEVDADPGSAVLVYGGSRILLRQVVDMSPVDRWVMHLNLDVPDVERTYQDLRGKGVKFARPPRMSGRGGLGPYTATFHDPDGHAITLTQWRDSLQTSASQVNIAQSGASIAQTGASGTSATGAAPDQAKNPTR